MNSTPLPEASRVELPILQELEDVGGSDQVRRLHTRLLRHFPQLLLDTAAHPQKRWLRLVNRAGRRLEERGELSRDRTRWDLTDKGRRRVQAEALHPIAPPAPASPVTARGLTHKEAQGLLVELGSLLGRHAEIEFETYDVVWRESSGAPRLSHVFEVQVAGNVDSALTRLKRAHETQRSRLYLVIADERDGEFAARRLQNAFPELAGILTVIGAGELFRLHQAVKPHTTLIEKLTARD